MDKRRCGTVHSFGFFFAFPAELYVALFIDPYASHFLDLSSSVAACKIFSPLTLIISVFLKVIVGVLTTEYIFFFVCWAPVSFVQAS